ncbi:RNA polymerase II elongation factor ELL2-like isoform X2 [Limulus polyphemus]|uniref:RNA polymerase II elongation factor ELL2-like isoform X2 n=1 Tax=Limulus polyphemus TaxID=6850 RepID=A0ABM1T842_LIMPO|nr:RNA polymerase II elongation factor ELL2-like isoform X2 [Limulus polyphemus]XP_022252049.1 RNA polymerase II elongation factor ELL2-like isoform X2 [Limulus polyphemus]
MTRIDYPSGLLCQTPKRTILKEALNVFNRRGQESLGSMLSKMQIHATEDSYEKTRYKMEHADLQSKRNCTKVIKTPGPNVGRKVEVKKPLSSIPPPPLRKTSSLQQILPTFISKPVAKSVNCNSQLGGTNRRPTPPPKSGNPDILRKSYRERIIHVLAVRPYKKPELLAKLMRDGIKEKDKKSLSVILSQVAVLKDNSFSLLSHAWNEVQDDWPFYTPQERELMKRQKPQNLTPPAENRPHSPSSLLSSNSPISQKRGPLEYEPYPGKKLRISHYQKPEVNGASPSLGFMGTCSETIFSKANSVLSSSKKQEPSPSGCIRTDQNDLLKPSSYALKFSCASTPPQTSTTGSDLVNGWTPEKSIQWTVVGVTSSPSESTREVADSSQRYINNRTSPDSHLQIKTAPKKDTSDSRLLTKGYVNHHHHNSSVQDRTTGVDQSKVSSTTVGSGSSPSSSPDSQDSLCFKGSQSYTSSPSTTCEVPEYLTKYVEITSIDQRMRYKTDFNADYGEYRKLHSLILEVSRRFAILEDRLGSYEKGCAEWERTTLDIKREYKEQKQKRYQDVKRRFQYLHNKLAHIKNLVMEYDQAHS